MDLETITTVAGIIAGVSALGTALVAKTDYQHHLRTYEQWTALAKDLNHPEFSAYVEKKQKELQAPQFKQYLKELIISPFLKNYTTHKEKINSEHIRMLFVHGNLKLKNFDGVTENGNMYERKKNNQLRIVG